MFELLYFHSSDKIMFAVHLKQSSLWPSANDKLMTNILALAMPDSACLLSLFVYYDIWYCMIATIANTGSQL
jgi:hypothetical protein